MCESIFCEGRKRADNIKKTDHKTIATSSHLFLFFACQRNQQM